MTVLDKLDKAKFGSKPEFLVVTQTKLVIEPVSWPLRRF